MGRRAAREHERQLEKAARQFRPARELVRSPWFEAAFAIATLMNSLVFCLEMQYRGLNVGRQVGYPGSGASTYADWPGADTMFDILEWIFGALFTLELLMRLVADRCAFFRKASNWIDALVVVFFFVGLLSRWVFFVNPTLLRLVRMTRILRMLQLVRQIHSFPSLWLLTTALRASMLALAGSLSLVFLVQMMIALLLTQMLASVALDEEARPLEQRMEVYRYFGTFSRSMFSIFELAIGNWPDCSRVLTERVSEWYLLFTLFYQCLVGFAVVRVVMGVFLKVTMDVAANDDLLMLNQRERAVKAHVRKMRTLFKAADVEGRGFLDREDFRQLVQDPRVSCWLGAMGCDVNPANADTVFTLLDGGEGKITVEELVKGTAGLKGNARSIDLAVLVHESHRNNKLFNELAAKAERMAAAVGAPLAPTRGRQLWAKLRDHVLGSPYLDSLATEPHPAMTQFPWVSECSRRSIETSMTLRSSLKSPAASHLMMELSGWANSESQETWRGRSAWLVRHPRTEAFFCLLIMSNSLVMAVEVQYNGINVGYRLGYPGSERAAAEAWPHANEVLEALEWGYGAAFAFELALKIVALGRGWVREAWNWLDAVIVVFWLAGAVARWSLDPMALRLVRMAKLLRMVRLMRTIQGFDGLYMMTAAIKGSMRAIPWSAVLIFLLESMFALALHAVLAPVMMDESVPLAQRENIYRYFGTYTKGLLTMCELTLANWAPASRTLVEIVGEGWIIFALGHKLTMGFAVINVLTGILLQETGKVAQNDDIIMIKSVEKTQERHTQKMNRLFREADVDGSGLIDQFQFRKVAEDESVKHWLSAMGMDVGDVGALFQLVVELSSSKNEHLSADELIHGVASLKGSARSIDLAIALHKHRKLQASARRLRDRLKGAAKARRGRLQPPATAR